MLQRMKSTEVQTSSLLVSIRMLVALNATKSLTLDATKYVIMTDVTARLNLAVLLNGANSIQDNNFHPILFDSITADVIRTSALHTEGSAGPSGVDAMSWR